MKRTLITVLSAILVMTMVFALAGCNPSEDKTAETKATTAATQAQTEKATEAATQAETQKATTTETQANAQNDSSDELVIPTVTGIWVNENNPDGCSIHIGVQNGNTIDVEITSVRGEAAQIATFSKTVIMTPEDFGNEIRGYAEFDYTDSFGNTGLCKLSVAENVVTLVVEEEEKNGSWGISNATGDYILKAE